MKNRLLTAAIALPLLALCLFVLPVAVTAIVLAVASAIVAMEVLQITGMVKNPRMCLYSMVIAFFVPIWCCFGMSTLWANLGIFVFFTLLFLEVMLSGMRIRFEKIAACMFAGLLLPYMFSGVIRILSVENGRWFVAIPFIIAFISDTGAFFAGNYFGKHKLAPKMSPHKTWEGLIGGIAASVLGMLVFTLLFDLNTDLRVSYLIGGLYGLLGAAAGAFGDLCFSVIKRQTGIKDYGNILPGHGGIMDRFDSFLTACLLIEILLQALPLGIV